MGTFLGSSQPQADEFAPYRIGPNGRIYITIYRKPDTPPPEGDREQRGTKEGDVGAYGPLRTVDAEGRPMSDFREAFLPTWPELITRDTRWMERMARLREGDVNSGRYTTTDDEGGSPPVSRLAIDKDGGRWSLNPPSSSYSSPNSFPGWIKDFPVESRDPGPLTAGYEAPGGTAPSVGQLSRPPVAEPATSLSGAKNFGAKSEFPAGLASPLPALQFNAPERAPGPREPGSYMDVPQEWTDGGYTQVSRTPHQDELTDFSSRHARRPVRPNPPPVLRSPRRNEVPGVRPVEVPRINEVRPNEIVDDIQQHLLNEYGPREYSLRSLQNSPSERAIAIFRAREYRPRNKVLDFERVMILNEKEVRDYCQKLKDVQDLTNETAAHVRATKPNLSAQAFGTEVHTIIENKVEALGDPNFRATISYLPNLPKKPDDRDEEKYGTRDSVRLDVMENVGDGTVCVYDVKTGRRGLSDLRMDVIARAVYTYFPKAERIVVTEIRPRSQ